MDKKTKENEELLSRREFFRKAAKGVLPMLGTMVLSSVPFLSHAVEENPMGCSRSSCHGLCIQHCSENCSGSCRERCEGGSGIAVTERAIRPVRAHAIGLAGKGVIEHVPEVARIVPWVRQETIEDRIVEEVILLLVGAMAVRPIVQTHVQTHVQAPAPVVLETVVILVGLAVKEVVAHLVEMLVRQVVEIPAQAIAQLAQEHAILHAPKAVRHHRLIGNPLLLLY